MTEALKKEKVVIGGFEMWVEIDGAFGYIYGSEKAQHPLLFDIMGSGEHIWINGLKLTPAEKIELAAYVKTKQYEDKNI